MEEWIRVAGGMRLRFVKEKTMLYLEQISPALRRPFHHGGSWSGPGFFCHPRRAHSRLRLRRPVHGPAAARRGRARRADGQGETDGRQLCQGVVWDQRVQHVGRERRRQRARLGRGLRPGHRQVGQTQPRGLDRNSGRVVGRGHRVAQGAGGGGPVQGVAARRPLLRPDSPAGQRASGSRADLLVAARGQEVRGERAAQAHAGLLRQAAGDGTGHRPCGRRIVRGHVHKSGGFRRRA
mmetsp:Transcript_1996/g.6608  ORF Transcript_1996/g.6608 Transcript_1996/m.6608 type:complete len:237 (+) Transcript_1996:664-1374(+)